MAVAPENFVNDGPMVIHPVVPMAIAIEFERHYDIQNRHRRWDWDMSLELDAAP
jgi:hypothetical protein